MRLFTQVAFKFIDTERIPQYMWLPDPSSPARDLVPPDVIQYLDHIVASKNCTLLITELHGSEWKPLGPMQSSGSATLVSDNGAHHHLSERMARKVFAQVALVHANGIVHRDVKDVNIVIDSTFKIKLIDIGCARGFLKLTIWLSFSERSRTEVPRLCRERPTAGRRQRCGECNF
ncbi:hypothetical protein HDU78_003624 [Chytriomyces hyalinus]|nr:hypothetical protein HDU78_003624 [Chytriomyces hyalinus]